MTGIVALYIFMLAAFTGYEIISRVPVILHTPLMSGSNFVHGIVLVGAMVALGEAHTTLEKSIGFIGVLLASYLVKATDGHADYFMADRAWFYVVLLSIGYMVSRGLAKSGSRHRNDA